MLRSDVGATLGLVPELLQLGTSQPVGVSERRGELTAQALACQFFIVNDQYPQLHVSSFFRSSTCGKRSVTMYSASNLPDFTSPRSPYNSPRRSRILASASR